MARFTESLLAKRDDPIYKEGLTISTPIWARGSKPPAKKSQGDKDTRPARGPRKPKTRK